MTAKSMQVPHMRWLGGLFRTACKYLLLKLWAEVCPKALMSDELVPVNNATAACYCSLQDKKQSGKRSAAPGTDRCH